VIIGIADRGEDLASAARNDGPGPQRRHVGIAQQQRIVEVLVQILPIVELAIGQEPRDHLGAGVFGIELLQVAGRAIDHQRRGRRQRRQEGLVGQGPGVADRRLVEDLDLRGHAVDQERRRQPIGAELGIGGDILPIVAEILGRERAAVRPAMALAQMEGEDAAFLDVEARQNVGGRR
jgi:hypothetical protein